LKEILQEKHKEKRYEIQIEAGRDVRGSQEFPEKGG